VENTGKKERGKVADVCTQEKKKSAKIYHWLKKKGSPSLKRPIIFRYRKRRKLQGPCRARKKKKGVDDRPEKKKSIGEKLTVEEKGERGPKRGEN